ncbi:MAG TPA: ABC transporter permease subunit [Methylomirabilota bacterium]|jgi:NitT/TauT family transport system permease protein|nr:ABC transporter permease subunit [Methylomirabilota bacterium]
MVSLVVVGWQALSLIVLVVVWEGAVRLGLADPLFIPAPSAVAGVLGATAGQVLPRLGDTLLKTLMGYALAVGLGVAGGLLIGSRRMLHGVVMPYVVALYSIPKILVLPWIALVFGFGVSTSVLSGALFAVFPIVLMVAAGTRDVDATLITVAASMGATRWQIGRKVLLPAVLPSVLAGMRVGMVFAMLGVLLAEMFAGNRGMGFLMQRLAMAFKAPELFAATAVVSVISIAVVLGLEHLNQRLGRWR